MSRSDQRAGSLRCAERVRELFGDELREEAGVVHVFAAWQPARGASSEPLRALTTGASMPASRNDPFVLRIARARTDAILTTGRNLRCEPRLTHGLLSSRADTSDVQAWREFSVGKRGLPDTVVLTRGEDLDLSHPVLNGTNRRWILTTSAAARKLAPAAARPGLEVIGLEAPSPSAAIDWLRSEHGFSSVCIEAGPSTSAQLYFGEPRVDELLLSLFEAETIDPSGLGPRFITMNEIERALPNLASTTTVAEPSGQWRYLRRTARGRITPR